MKRPFYIIHHNPNKIGSVDDKGTAIHALAHGANALGPDVVFEKGNLWVHHYDNPLDGMSDAPLLADYLDQLAEVLLNNKSLKLYLLAFDIKNTDDAAFSFKGMQKIIQEHFSSKVPGVRMVFTTPDDFNFLFKQIAPHLLPGQALGPDQFGKPREVYNAFKDRGYPYIFSHGNSTILNTLYKVIEEAVEIRDSVPSFELVYPWVINFKGRFRQYLDLGVDGIMTNRVEELKELIEKEYADKYVLTGPAFEEVLAH